MFARIPGPNGMKPVPQLALDVDEFGLQGATGEAVYGNPKEVEREELVREWSEGLKTDGGGGYVRNSCRSLEKYLTLCTHGQKRAQAAERRKREGCPERRP